MRTVVDFVAVAAAVGVGVAVVVDQSHPAYHAYYAPLRLQKRDIVSLDPNLGSTALRVIREVGREGMRHLSSTL